MQPKLLGILAFFNMQLLSSSAGEKDRKKLVCDPQLRTNLITDNMSVRGFAFEASHCAQAEAPDALIGLVCSVFSVRLLKRKNLSTCVCAQALTSVMELMRLMGSKHISSVRVKMMTTLRTGLRYKEDFPLLCCQSVHAFTL